MLYQFKDVWLVAGARTPFTDFNGSLKELSATDLAIVAAKGALSRSGIDPKLVDATIVGNVAQSSLDSYYLARHVALYSGVGIDKPALIVNRICCSGFEAVAQGAMAIQLGSASTVLAAGTESMSRTPVVAYGMRSGFRLGQVQFYDSLWETLRDSATDLPMGMTAENLARQYKISRDEVDDFAAESFARALKAQKDGFYDDEIVPVTREAHELSGYATRKITLPRGVESVGADDHVRPTSKEKLSALPPAFGGVQTAGNSSAIVDGAGAVMLVSGEVMRREGLKPLARIVSSAIAGVPPEIMGIGPAPAIREVAEGQGISVRDIGRFDINEAFGAQLLAVQRELDIDLARVNVNGGAIAIGHPLGATGIRCTLTAAREARRAGERYAVSSACAGGGQGMAILMEIV
ncbi:MAG: thiolase family protein [Thermomonas sp.]|uniref:thiolase family protein n=1 Tax=Thermomonas sp. TaxID=1971895 RepID=UPI00260FA5ED|nr:thiolase family protein [Thermomonas sp.]MCC7096828.1 thiolase family protein [Thermomonas sp.]